jgi:HK97 family phage major capsid protein
MNKKEYREAQKRLVVVRNRTKEIDARLAEIESLIKKENRKMNDDENEEFRNLSEEKSALLNERDFLRLGCEQFRSGVLPEDKQEDLRYAFARLLTNVRNHQPISEEMRSMVNSQGEIVIPNTRALTDTSSISPVVPITVGELMLPLNNGIVYDKLGLKIQTGLKGTFNFPAVTGVEATFEDENVEVSDQSISMSKLTGNPKRIAISVPVSNTAIDESNVNLQSLVISLFNTAMANLLNKWMLSKTAITKNVAAPNGPFVAAVAAPAVSVAKGVTPKWKDIVALEAAVQKKHLPVTGTSGFVCSSSMIAELRTQDKGTDTGRYIAEAVGRGEYQIDGYPVFISEDVDDNTIEFGVFEYDLLGQFGEVRLVVDPYTDSKKNITRFVFNTRWDNVVLRPEAFVALVRATA